MTIEQLGPYKIEKVLGRGGMGTVYAGVHDETGERAAIKVLPETLAHDPRFRERFRSEVETLKKLQHRSIVELYGHGEEQGILYFVMELVEGSDLETELRDKRKFPWREVLDIGVQVCGALKHAHDSGVIHRDLKPANLLVTNERLIKLTDFGIAKLFGNTGLTMAGSMIGTPEYMSPEQAHGHAVTARSDLYSLGCVMFALLAGRPPFHAESVTQVIDRVRHADPPSLHVFADGIPDEMEAIVRQLLDKDPHKRIATAQLLARRLKAMEHGLRSHRPVTAEPQGPSEIDDSDPAKPGSTQVAGQTRDGMEKPNLTAAVDDNATAEMSATNLDADLADPSFEVSESALVETRDGTINEIGNDALNSTAPTTHFTPVTEEERRRTIDGESDAASKTTWITTAAIAVVLLAIVAAFVAVLQPMNADQHFAKIQQVNQAEPPTINGEMLMLEFLERFPQDPRAADIRSQLEKYRVRKLRYDLQNKIRTLTASEKLFLESCQLADAGQFEQSVAQLQKILDEIGDDPVGPNEAKLADCARTLLSELSNQ